MNQATTSRYYPFSVSIKDTLMESAKSCGLVDLLKKKKISIDPSDQPDIPAVWITDEYLSDGVGSFDWQIIVGGSAIEDSLHCFELVSFDFESIKKLISLISDHVVLREGERLRDRTWENLNLILDGVSDYYELVESSAEYVSDFTLITTEFLQKYIQFFSCSNESELFEVINDYVSSSSIIQSIELRSGEDSETLLWHENRGDLIYPVLDEDRDDYIVVSTSEDSLLDNSDKYYLFNLLSMISGFMRSFSTYRKMRNRNSLWEEAFSRMPVPTALISSQGELVLYNQDFLKLNFLPGECLRFEDGEEVEKDEDIYKVHKVAVDDEQSHILITFSEDPYKHRSQYKNVTSGELGIISSSIAHELNNPIGGILAALTLLEMEDHWSEEELQSLVEMKKSANRCKGLVEVFLGFSKASPNSIRSSESNFMRAFEQAMNLLRFRMMESNIRMEIMEDESPERYEKESNASICAMIFYLILSEVMTSFSHFKLVADRHDNCIAGTITEFDDRIEIEFNVAFEFVERIRNSKLIGQLADLIDLNLYFTPNKIILQ